MNMMRTKQNLSLPEQWLHMGTKELTRDLFGEIKNARLRNKPRGGLWASPYEKEGEYLSDWHKASVAMRFPTPPFAVRFSLKEEARVCVIDHQLHLMEITRHYPAHNPYEEDMFFFEPKYINYERLFQDFDVIYLTKRGQWDTHLPTTNSAYDLHGWDCASCIILNFDVIEHQETINIKQYQR